MNAVNAQRKASLKLYKTRKLVTEARIGFLYHIVLDSRRYNKGKDNLLHNRIIARYYNITSRRLLKLLKLIF